MTGVRSVEPLDGFRVRVTLTDGSVRTVDLEPLLWGPMFERARCDAEYFAAVRVDPVSETLCWPGGEDLAPEVLTGEHVPATRRSAAS